jgi:hypothetical protein
MTNFFVQIVEVNGIDIRPPKHEWRNKNGKKLSDSDARFVEFLLHGLGEENQNFKDWEQAAKNLFEQNEFLSVLFQCGTCIEVGDRNHRYIGMENVRSIINSDRSVTFQVNLFHTGVPG